jgi:hypothetical protein
LRLLTDSRQKKGILWIRTAYGYLCLGIMKYGSRLGATVAIGNSMRKQGGKGTLLMDDLFSLLRPPYIFLILGVISFSGAVVSTCTGKTWARFEGSIDRSKEPNNFWSVVAIYFLGSLLFIGLFLY